MTSAQQKAVYIATNGCRRRALDVGRLERYFTMNGYRSTPHPAAADVMVLVTCSFMKSREDECYQLIQSLAENRGELIVAGCLPEIAAETFHEHFNGRYISTKNIGTIDGLFPDFTVHFDDVPDAHEVSRSVDARHTTIRHRIAASLRKGFVRNAWRVVRTRLSGREKSDVGASHLRVSWGCLNNCSYCSIRRAVGKLRSKSLDLCKQEYREELDLGARQFVILADDVGSYGLDLKSDFAALLQALRTVDAGVDVKWQIRELHPRWAVRYRGELVQGIQEGRIRHILCPVQSGSSRILGLMNRYADAANVERTLLEFKRVDGHALRLDTHAIIGFPSETEEEFQATMNLICKVRFEHVNLFPFYDGFGTPASEMADKVAPEVIHDRLERGVAALEDAGIAVSWDTPRY